MPFLKRSPTRETRSQRLETAAALSGLRHAVFGLNGTKYIGEWKNNKKSGGCFSFRILQSVTTFCF